MGKGRKTHNKDKEDSRLRKLYEENKHLRRQIERLRKELSKIDIDRYTNLQEIVAAQAKEEKQLHQKSKRESLLDKWHCYECDEGYLRLIIVNRMDGIWYFRRCKDCGHKTKLKRYTDNVEGVIDE